jgi:hypothetical protein
VRAGARDKDKIPDRGNRGPADPALGYRELAGLGGGPGQGHVNGKSTELGENTHVAVVGRKYNYYYEIIKLLRKLASRKQNNYS